MSTSTLLVDPEGKLRIVPTASAGKELKQRFGLRPVYVNHLLNPSHNRNTLNEWRLLDDARWLQRVDTGELHVVVGLLPHFCKHFSDERRAARWPADQHKTPRSRHSYPFGWWPVAGQQQEVDDVDEVEGGAGKAVAQRAALLRAGRRRRRVRCSAHGAAARTSLRPAPPRRTRHRWRQINSAGPTPVAAPPGAGRRAAQGRLDNGENESGRLPVFHDLHRRHGDGGAAMRAEEARMSFGDPKRPKFSRLRRAPGPPAALAAGPPTSKISFPRCLGRSGSVHLTL